MHKILIIDDEEGILLLWRLELEDVGYEVHCAYNGDEGLSEYNKIIPDLVILDINMPGMNGIEVLRRIKEISDTPVILHSAYREYKQDIGSWASENYIVKSPHTGELLDAIEQLLSI